MPRPANHTLPTKGWVNKGNYIEHDTIPDPDFAMRYFWSSRLNVRPMKDAIVLRGVVKPRARIEARRQLNITLGNEHPKVSGLDVIDELTAFIVAINTELGAQADDVRQYVASGGGIEAHIDAFYDPAKKGNKHYLGKSSSAVVSIGLAGCAFQGLSAMQSGWTMIEGDVFDASGNIPTVAELRTNVLQEPGDVTIIRPGIVHAVEAEPMRQALLIAQNNRSN